MLTKTPKTEAAIRAEEDSSAQALDAAMMARCIALSRTAVDAGEFPFATVIALDGKVVAEAINRTVRDNDVSRHAEVIALSQAQKALTRQQLQKCTLYTNVEPCAMCSYAIRETRIARVIYSIKSPMMGGLSKWNVLRDPELSRAMPEVFGPVPEVIAGLLRREAESVWSKWNPLYWSAIRLGGYLGGCEHLPGIPERRRFLRSLFARLGHKT